MEFLYVIKVMDLAIKAMNEERRSLRHMAVLPLSLPTKLQDIATMVSMEEMKKYIGDKDLHGTKGEILLQDQEVY